MKRHYLLRLHGFLNGKYTHVLRSRSLVAAVPGDLMNFHCLVVQLKYWNGRSRQPDGFWFSGITT